ncbi:non-repetitive nucleoporin-like protein [Plenodomus tracheiphilus IPT5]|uniref:Non-repetitive nucleoporin-like protein n=1 Tax=Plenodomus tracheiphilus IPT5 TaxID=1408161 RepID=A0A6A7ANB8_9PLEO|nr:non-repetitive nucleoporin-like protein [Plenodomus tracheiphilus IPT5]
MAFQMAPATPQRPGPGAFINTPAPNRPNFQRQASVSHQQPQQQQALPAPPAESPVDRASRTINNMLDRDSRFPALEATVGQGSSGDYEIESSPAWAPFQQLRSYKLPEAVFEQVNQTQISTSMGLFAEINHAWVTVDNQVYLWDYTHPNPELIGFEEQPSNITCVKLVKPRPKVFVDSIDYLLVVATIADIFLIAVECQRGPEGVHGVTLYRTGLATSVKKIMVDTIAGSDKTGRIFFGDRNTEDVYELNYQQEDKWFSSKCSRTNHVSNSVGLSSWYSGKKEGGTRQMVIDDTRNILYTLSSLGTIKVYYMKTPSTLECVITRTRGQLATMCGHIIQSANTLKDLNIVGLSPITSTEADNLSLMATTSSGCRLYLSTTAGGAWNASSTSAPTSMQLRHIRFPPNDGRPAPPNDSTQIQQYQGGAHVGFDSEYLRDTKLGNRYAPGAFFSFVQRSPNDINETAFISTPHSGLLSQRDSSEPPRYLETALELNLVGRVRDMGQVSESSPARNQPLGFRNELATQFDQPLCEYAIITSHGIETIRRRRLVDIFASIVRSGGHEAAELDIRKLAKQYGLAETSATALAVACGQGSDVGPDSRIAKVTDPEVLEFARRVFIEFGGKPHLTESATVEGLSVDNVRASPRHDGIAMYVARLIRSIWNSPIITEVATPTGPVLTSTHKIARLQEVQRSLAQLQEFLESNKTYIEGLAGPEALGRVSSRQEEVELQGENRALTSLLLMINNIVEGISFVLVLFEERLEDIVALLDPELQIRVRRLTFQGLFSVKEGKDLARELVKAIVNRNITKGSNVETVAESLRRKCGSFCSSDDVVIFKAQENLKKAFDSGANAERGRILLNDSLRLFEQVAKSLNLEILTATVNKYIELEFYAGAIRLALRVAQEADRGNKALSWLRDQGDAGTDPNDIRRQYYDRRAACYTLVCRVIEAVDQAYNSQGPIPDGVISQISRRKHEAYEQINNSDDEVFQNYLYDWYMSRGWAERLLEINSPFVVDYLRQSSEKDIAHADLLWRYYAHYNDYLSAAETQYQLAKSSLPLTLEKRIEYLSRAKANASTRMTGFSETGVRNRQSRQELLRNISDYLDIANIQDDVLQRIKGDERLNGERRAAVIEHLNGQIHTLDELYHDYADQAGYYDICLLIYHIADYRSVPDIRSTWTNLVDRLHHTAVKEQQSSPWETVALKVQDIGHRVNLNDNVFPINIVLQLLLQYDLEFYVHDANTAVNPQSLAFNANITWPIDVFLKLNAPFESLISTLEALWYAQEAPFSGRNRKLLVKWIIYTIEQWAQTSRRTGTLFGGAENAIGLAELLRIVLGSEVLGRDMDDQTWIQRARDVSAVVEEAAR